MNTNIAILGDMFEWADGNPNKQDRTGWTVTVDKNGTISRAYPNEEVIGVVASSDDSVGLVVNTWMNEWHAKHVRDWSGRLQYEKQELVTWVRDGRREMHETDRLPDNLVIPDDAERWTHWPDTGEKLERPQLNPKFNDGSQKSSQYQGRLLRHEWAVVVVLGKAAVLEGSQIGSRWVPMQTIPESNSRLWFIR